MIPRSISSLLLCLATLLTLPALLQAAEKKEITGAAILDHPCGKVAVQHMELIHAGKMDEAAKLGTPAMQEQWKKMPAEDRDMLNGVMKEMSVPGPQFSQDIKAGGLLAIDGTGVTLTVKRRHQDANGSSTETWTQTYVLDHGTCQIAK